MFYWEVIIVNIRKVLFISIIISLQRATTMYQPLVACFLLYFMLALLRWLEPYNSQLLLNIDIAAT